MKEDKLESFRFGRGAATFVLLIVAQGPSYGYEIRRSLEEFGYERVNSDPGALYRLLRDMESDGSIVSQWDVAGTGPARRYYSLSEQGQGDLKRGAERMEIVRRRAEQFLAAYGRFSDQDVERGSVREEAPAGSVS